GEATQGNYAVTYATGTLTITAANTLTVTGVDGSKVYDGAALSTTATTNVTAGTTIEYKVGAGEWTTTAPSITDVSSVTVSVRATNPNYTTATGSYTLTVTPKAVTVTANNKTKVYGAADPTFDAAVTGLLGSDTVDYALNREPGNNVGTYTITPSGEATQGNYAVTYATGTLTITAANTLTVTGVDGSKVYDGAALSTTATANVTDGTTIEYKVGAGAWTATAPSITDVGSVTVSVRATNPNYTTATGSYTLAVTPKAVTVTANNKTKVYGAADPTFDAAVTGLLGSDTVDYALNRAPGNNVGSYTITPSGAATQGNYAVTYATGTLTITAKAVTVTANDKTKVYGETDPALDAAVAGLLGEDTVDYALNRAPGNDVGSYTITPSGAATQGNYTVTYATGTLTITPKAVTVTANDKTKTYGVSDPTFDATVAGLVGSDKLTYAFNRTPGESVGSYTITPSGEATQGNYTVTYAAGTLTITRATLIVRADNKDKQPNMADPTLTWSMTGIGSGDTQEALNTLLGITISRAPGESLGSYPITVTGETETQNYIVTYVPGTLKISMTYYRVRYLDWDGRAVYDNSYLGLGSVVAIPGSPARADYRFTGWAFESGIALAANGACRGNATYRATYVPLTVPTTAYTVRFEDYDGTLISEKDYALGDKAVYPSDPTRSDFDFTGWEYYSGVSLGAGDTVRGDVTYRAAYTASTTTITEPQTPQAARSAWALLNLILTIVTALISVILLVGYFGKKDKDEKDEKKAAVKAKKDEDKDDTKRKGGWRLSSLVPTVGAIVAFILTENMKNPMVFTDKWTLLMAVIAIIQVVVAFLSKKSNKDDDEDKGKAAAAKA
ncbi:MAG: MBG domain-containing protein, partial [Oscillospiraceae bacterium]|nr:MBG domain-containing protein [Oscillospiraceae bacterium]